MKHKEIYYRKPTAKELLGFFDHKMSEKIKEKVIFSSQFSLKGLLAKKTIVELAIFFELNAEYLKAVVKMQEELLRFHDVLPKIFPDTEGQMILNGEFARLKDSQLYRRLKRKKP